MVQKNYAETDRLFVFKIQESYFDLIMIVGMILILIIMLFFFIVVVFSDDIAYIFRNKVSSKRKNKDVEELKAKFVELTVEVNELKERVYLLEKTNEIVDTIKKKKCYL